MRFSLKFKKILFSQRKYFLDFGSHNGCSVRKFLNLFPDSKNYIIHCFEPNPIFKDCYREFENVIFHQEAVWVQDGEGLFYLDKRKKCHGSSLIYSKISGNLDKKNPIKVKSIDISKWIINNFQKKDDFIVLKMDIEGAEYKVLNKMIHDGSIEYINKLYIEFHIEKIDMPLEIHKNLVKQLMELDLKIEYWDALK